MDEEKNHLKKIGKRKITEEATKYGEFVSSYFGWIPIPKQKETAEKLENITKDKNV